MKARRWPILYGLMLSLCIQSCHASEEQLSLCANSPPRTCEIQHRSWCLLYGDVTYENIPSNLDSVKSHWIIRGSTWRNFPLLIDEPRGCREKFADTVELIKKEKNVLKNGTYMDKFTVKIRKDGTCDFNFFYQNSKADPTLGAFFAALTLFKPCYNEFCLGDPIAEKVRNEIDP